jgi:hypothetical protein
MSVEVEAEHALDPVPPHERQQAKQPTQTGKRSLDSEPRPHVAGRPSLKVSDPNRAGAHPSSRPSQNQRLLRITASGLLRCLGSPFENSIFSRPTGWLQDGRVLHDRSRVFDERSRPPTGSFVARKGRHGPDTDRACGRSRKRVGSLGAVKCAAGAAFSPAGGAVILRTLATFASETPRYRPIQRSCVLCARTRSADADARRSTLSEPQKPALVRDSSRLLADGGVSGSSVHVRARETAAACSLGAPSPRRRSPAACGCQYSVRTLRNHQFADGTLVVAPHKVERRAASGGLAVPAEQVSGLTRKLAQAVCGSERLSASSSARFGVTLGSLVCWQGRQLVPQHPDLQLLE